MERALPKGVHLRRGLVTDELPTFDVMRRAMGFDINWEYHATTRNYIRETAGCIFWVAEERSLLGVSKLLGYARALVRDNVMCLTEFFVLPNHHGAGIGSALLDNILKDAQAAGAEIKMVLASQSPAAQKLYIQKAGCYPRMPMLMFSALESAVIRDTSHLIQELSFKLNISSEKQENVHTTATLAHPILTAEAIRLTPDIEEQISEIDRQIVGYARPLEHRHWALETGGVEGAGRLFRYRETAEIAGYAYMGAHFCGPILSLTPEYQPWMMTHVISLRNAFEKHENGIFAAVRERYCSVAGINETMLNWLVRSGWKLMFHYTFMSSKPMGQLDCYIGHEPLYLL